MGRVLLTLLKRQLTVKVVAAVCLGLLIFTTAHSLIFLSYLVPLVDDAVAIRTVVIRVVIYDAFLFALFAVASYVAVGAVFSPMRRLTQTVESIRDGDLTSRARIESDDEIGMIANTINDVLDRIRDLVKGTQVVGNELSEAAGQIAASVENQASGASEQAASITETSATMEELAQTTRQIAENTKSVVTATETALQSAEVGRSGVDKTIAAMDEIKTKTQRSAERIMALGERTQRIGAVIVIINEIADQTRILALNAAIEAARAGEAGKGFTVVASEIRKLADSVTDSTEEIRKIMEEIQTSAGGLVVSTEEELRKVESGAGLARQAGAAIEDMVDRVQEINRAAQQISIATQQEISASDQVSEAMREIAIVSQQSAASSLEVANSVELLKRLSEQLKEEISRVRVSSWWHDDSVAVNTDSVDGGEAKAA